MVETVESEKEVMTTTFEKSSCNTLIVYRNSLQHSWFQQRMVPEAIGPSSENFVAYIVTNEDLQQFSVEFYSGKN